VAADLCFGIGGKSWISKIPVIKTYAVLAFIGIVFYLSHDPVFETRAFQILPFLLAVMVGLKFLLAQWAFRSSLKKHLLARSSINNYLIIWSILALAFIVPIVLLFHREKWIVSVSLGIILLLPLARIGFSPLAVSFGRHR